MKRTNILLTILCLLTTTEHLSSQPKRFEYITAIEGLSQNTVFDIEQDKNGFLWIATYEGLNRFDSYGFKVYYTDTTENSIPSNETRTLLVGSEGRLFVGTADGLCIYNPEYDNFIQIRYKGESLGRINDIFETSKKRILVSSAIGVFYLSQDGTIKNRLPLENRMNNIQEDSYGNFWCTKPQRIFHFNEKGILLKTYYVKPTGLPNSLPSPISSLIVDSKDCIWIGTFRNGPFLLDPKKEIFRPVPLKKGYGAAHPMYYIRDIF